MEEKNLSRNEITENGLHQGGLVLSCNGVILFPSGGYVCLLAGLGLFGDPFYSHGLCIELFAQE